MQVSKVDKLQYADMIIAGTGKWPKQMSGIGVNFYKLKKKKKKS